MDDRMDRLSNISTNNYVSTEENLMVASLSTGGEWLTAGGWKTWIHDVGAGEPVLLLHGSGPGVSAESNWRNTIPALCDNHRVLAPDIVGFGATERPADAPYGVDLWVQQVVDILDSLGIAKTSVVGNSMGGRIALGLATRVPERLNRMVLMGSGGLVKAPSEGLKAIRAYEPSEENMRRLIIDYFTHDSSLATPELVRERYEASVSNGAHDKYQEVFHSPNSRAQQLGASEDDIRAIETPTLIIHGREDKVISPENSLRMHQLIYNSELHMFGKCGHWVQLEHKDRFNELVQHFLD